MKLIALIFLMSVQNNFQFSNWTKFEFPFYKKDLIRINKVYGKQKRPQGVISVIQKECSGISYEVKENSPALSIESGKIEAISSSKYYGDFIVINHGGGIKAKYYHLKKITLKVGAEIKKGDIVGISSDKGLTTVNSIGLEIKLNGKRVNPTSILNEK